MKILGIDPGLQNTGYGVVEFVPGESVRLKEAGFIHPKAKDLFEQKIFKIHQLLDEIIQKHQPDVIVLEKLYAHYKHPITASILGHVRGVICLLCAQRKVELVELSVKRIRKALTGNGNATKEQARRLICGLLKLKESQLTLDTSDALALALGYAHMRRYKIL